MAQDAEQRAGCCHSANCERESGSTREHHSSPLFLGAAVRGRGQWERWRREGLGRYRAHSAAHRVPQPSARCRCVGETQAGELARLGREKIWGNSASGVRLLSVWK